MSSINLLKTKKQTAATSSIKELFLLRWIAIGLLFVISSLSIILFLLIALSPLPRLQKQRENDLRTLSSYHPEMAKFYLIEERLKSSGLILDKRRNFDELLTTLIDQIPNQLSVMSFSLKDKNISITVNSTSLSSINTFFEDLVALVDSKKAFSSVVLADLTVNQQQNSFSATVNLTAL